MKFLILSHFRVITHYYLNFRDMLNRSPTGEQKKKESTKPNELNDDQCSDECLNVEQFKELLAVTGSEHELQLHANEEDLE